MRDLTQLNGREIQAHGHCRIDYTDPITGKVRERIEGDNHVFTGQFCSTSFQTSALRAKLLLTDGEAALDTDFPWIPGWPVGYGEIDRETEGIYRGSFRATGSEIGVITASGVNSKYIYDFLPTQIPRKIGYVGLSGNYGNAATAPFTYDWPGESFVGIYDIARRIRFRFHNTSLPSTAGGDGSIEVGARVYVPPKSPESKYHTFQLFDLLGRPENVWPNKTYTSGNSTYNQSKASTYGLRLGYDYENQRVVIYLTRCCSYYYSVSGGYISSVEMKDDVWSVSLNLSTQEATLHEHYSHEWTAREETTVASRYSEYWYYYHPIYLNGDYSPRYFRLYNGVIYAFTTILAYTLNYQQNRWRIVRYNIASGEFSETTETIPNTNMAGPYLNCYKGYTWAPAYRSYLSGNEFLVSPIYDIYTNSFYASMPSTYFTNSNSYYDRFVEKGIVSVYPNTWTLSPYLYSTDHIAVPSMPFAYTAWKVPADAPERPANSAVTVSYELSVNW